MSSEKEMLDDLVSTACENGETIHSYGKYNEDSQEGHNVELIEHGGLWVVVDTIDDKESLNPFTDEAEALEAFSEIKASIEKEEVEE